MTSPGNEHCANCIGTLLFPVLPRAGKVSVYAETSNLCCPMFSHLRIYDGTAADSRTN